MHRVMVAAGAIVALTATACNSTATPQQDVATAPETDKSAPATSAPARAAAPVPTEGYDWAMRVDADNRAEPAILAYEMDNTDDQPLSLSCERGGNRVFAGIAGGAADLRQITLTSGDQTLRLNGTSRATEIDDMPEFTSEEIDGHSPFLRAFAQNGWARLTVNGRTTDMASASTTGARAITQFVAHCTATGG